MRLHNDILFCILSHLDQPHEACQVAIVLGIPINDIKKNIADITSLDTDIAVQEGYTDLLRVLREEHQEDFALRHEDLNVVCARGHVNVLNWIMQTDISWKFSRTAIDHASAFGQIAILQWFKNSGTKLKYSPNCIENAFLNNKLQCVTWWFQSGLKYRGRLKILQRLMNQHLFEAASMWLQNDKLPKPTSMANEIHYACVREDLEVLQFYQHMKLPLEVYSDTLWDCCKSNCESVKVSDWLLDNGLIGQCHDLLISLAIKDSHGMQQKWWCEHIKAVRRARKAFEGDCFPCFHPIDPSLDLKRRCLIEGDRIVFFHDF